jgi:hypothetical protein
MARTWHRRTASSRGRSCRARARTPRRAGPRWRRVVREPAQARSAPTSVPPTPSSPRSLRQWWAQGPVCAAKRLVDRDAAQRCEQFAGRFEQRRGGDGRRRRDRSRGACRAGRARTGAAPRETSAGRLSPRGRWRRVGYLLGWPGPGCRAGTPSRSVRPRARGSDTVAESINPATGQVLGRWADGGEAEAGAAIASIRRAFDTTEWSRDRNLRHRALSEMANRFDAHAEELGRQVTMENGKRLSEGMMEGLLPSVTLNHGAGRR